MVCGVWVYGVRVGCSWASNGVVGVFCFLVLESFLQRVCDTAEVCMRRDVDVDFQGAEVGNRPFPRLTPKMGHLPPFDLWRSWCSSF